MAHKSNKPYWFSAKGHGFGWGLPASWQGWTTALLYAALLAGGLLSLQAPAARLIYAGSVTIAFIAIVIWKGERPAKWRWGRR